MSEDRILVESRWLAASVRMFVLASAGALMLPGAWEHSVTAVELAHLPSGLAAWQDHTLGIYRVCGPVSKLLYALPAYLAGVRLDWGQDLARLGRWVARHANEGSTLICIYGLGTGIPYGLQPPAARSISEPGDNPAYLAVSEDILHGYEQNTIQVDDGRSWLDPDQRERLLRLRPFARVGRTIRIYRLRDFPASVNIPQGAVKP
jgi:hypothetical protein